MANKLTEEHKANIRAGCKRAGVGKWMQGKKMSEETKQKLSAANVGKVLSDEHKEKISTALIGRPAPWAGANGFQNGSKPWNLGGTFTEETKEKLSASHIKYYDLVGRSDVSRSYHYKDRRYMDWRARVFGRGNFTCQDCGQVGGSLNAHHIMGWSKHPELRYVDDNGVTLCEACHKERHKKR